MRGVWRFLQTAIRQPLRSDIQLVEALCAANVVEQMRWTEFLSPRCGCTIDAHGFIDPVTGKIVKHLKKRHGRTVMKRARNNPGSSEMYLTLDACSYRHSMRCQGQEVNSVTSSDLRGIKQLGRWTSTCSCLKLSAGVPSRAAKVYCSHGL